MSSVMSYAKNAAMAEQPTMGAQKHVRSTAAKSGETNRSRTQRYSVWAGGLQWHIKRYQHKNNSDKARILLLHGTGSSIHSWNGIFPGLTEHFDVLAPDLPGHGDTLGAGESDLTLEGMSAVLGTLLKEIEYQPDLLIGHSAGAAVALKMSCEKLVSPRLIIGINAALLPYGGRLAPVFRPIARFFASMPGVPGLVAARARKPGAVERLISGSGSQLGDEEISHYRHLLSSRRHISSTLSMMANWRLEGLLEDFQKTVIPLVLVVADQDRMVEPWQAEKAREIATHAKLVHLPGLGHLAHEEDPQAVEEAVVTAWKRENKQ